MEIEKKRGNYQAKTVLGLYPYAQACAVHTNQAQELIVLKMKWKH